MKRLLITAASVLALTAAPAFAHEGFHFHPHGVQFGWLVAAVIGAHINAALGWLWMHRGKAMPEPGIGDFLKRRSPGAKRRTDDTR